VNTALRVDGLSLAYGRQRVLEDLSLSLSNGDIGCLLGPSGSGKTTLLRAIAGFQQPLAGSIAIMDTLVASDTFALPPEQRKIGMVFQDFALFPHLTVWENIGFGLRPLKPTARKQRIEELLNLVGLRALARRYPHTLSGGQQQRVALARALAPRPALLLLDEPFASIDVELREHLAAEVRAILKTNGTSAVLVSHHQLEAFAMADSIGVLCDGKLLQWDTAYNLYHRPASPRVADFIGEGVLLAGRRTGAQAVQTEAGQIRGLLPSGLQDGAEVLVLIRPDDVVPDESGDIKAVILRKAFRGAQFLYTLVLPSGKQILSLMPSHMDFALSATIGVRLVVDHLVVFPKPDTAGKTKDIGFD
jgi:iron(III) transport system ATP-binding protein